MRATDLKDLINGLLLVIFIALALGKYDKLAAWARREAFGSRAPVPSIWR